MKLALIRRQQNLVFMWRTDVHIYVVVVVPQAIVITGDTRADVRGANEGQLTSLFI
jgi:hypothetical protein